MKALLEKILGRLPIGWLQLSHSKTRLFTATAGVTFANVLVFVQLGILGALNNSSIAPYSLFKADIMISPADANTLSENKTLARQRMFQALGSSGVDTAVSIYIGMIDWNLPDGSSASLQVFGIDPDQTAFLSNEIATEASELRLANTAFIDSRTRGIPSDTFETISSKSPLKFELNGQTISTIGLLSIGSGFSSDGSLLVSDQTFLELFPGRSAGAPNHILVNAQNDVIPDIVVDNIRKALPPDTVKVNTLENAIKADLNYQTTERPTGIIFGFGVLIGVLVGIVIVYQVLATDVANHLREYATFKAMGYKQAYFTGVVFEEAVILAVLGFIPGVLIALSIYTGLAMATGLPVYMEASRAAFVFLGTVAACCLSGAIATRRLAKADPADLF